jgi:acetyl esterase
VAGDSAGGCVAALALRDGGDGDLLAAQVLACPNTDLTGRHPSMTDKGTGFGLEAADVRWAAAQWMPDVTRHADGDVSPLRAEGDAYAARLAEAGYRSCAGASLAWCMGSFRA